MSSLVSVEQFRSWSGAASSTVPDSLIQATLDEAEAGILADLPAELTLIEGSTAATHLAAGEELRRAARLLARRNSPESIAGVGEFSIIIPSRDPDSARTLQAIRALLLIPEGVA